MEKNAKKKVERKEALEWIKQRKSKGRSEEEIYYRGAEISRRDLKDAVMKCRESEKEERQREEEQKKRQQVMPKLMSESKEKQRVRRGAERTRRHGKKSVRP